jgi:hypothetical protein
MYPQYANKKRTYPFLRGASLIFEDKLVLIADEHLMFLDLDLDRGLLVGGELWREVGFGLF